MSLTFLDVSKQRIVTVEEAVRTAMKWEQLQQTTVFTNGCFDLIHSGHLAYLSEAAGLADRLIIGLNSDRSVRMLKGETRPVKSQDTRALLLASLRWVDMVVIFDEETPSDLISTLRPDVLVKGGDWKVEEIVGGDIVTSYGGIVRSLPYIEGYSSSNYIEKIVKNA